MGMLIHMLKILYKLVQGLNCFIYFILAIFYYTFFLLKKKHLKNLERLRIQRFLIKFVILFNQF